MSEIRSAVILAAGRGTRMGELTADLPKPMLPVHGRPILEHVLEGLSRVGVERFFVVVGYRRETIEEYFRNWKRDGFHAATHLIFAEPSAGALHV